MPIAASESAIIVERKRPGIADQAKATAAEKKRQRDVQMRSPVASECAPREHHDDAGEEIGDDGEEADS